MSAALSIVVQHAPWDLERRGLLTSLLLDLQRQVQAHRGAYELTICEPVRVERDHGASKASAEGVWPVNRRAWLTGLHSRPAPSHVLVLQDDMELVPNFFVALERALEGVHDRPLCLLCARRDVQRAVVHSKRWVALPDGTWGGSTVLPAKMVTPFIHWVDKHVDEHCPSADARLDLYLRAHSEIAYATVPSLIEHVGEKSLIGHSKGRRASYLSVDGRLEHFPPPTAENTVVSRKGLNVAMTRYLKAAACAP